MVAREGEDSASWRRVGEMAALAAVPVPVLAALLFYFGFVRSQVICGYFGIEVSLLGFSATDFDIRSARVVSDPLTTLGMSVLLGIAVHLAVTWALRRQPPSGRLCRAAAPVALGLGALLLLGALDGLGRLPGGPAVVFVSSMNAALMLGAGAVLLEYAVYLAEQRRLRGWRQRRRSRRRRDPAPPPLMSSALTAGRRLVVVGLLLSALFWGFTVKAAQQGAAVTNSIARSVASQPEAIVYTRRRLQISGFGVAVVPLPGGADDWHYRYTGLHVLFYSGKRWFLLPTEWRRDNGAPVVILNDDPTTLRVDMRP